jgi:hypothetical protein
MLAVRVGHFTIEQHFTITHHLITTSSVQTSQPLDVGFFGPLRAHLERLLWEYQKSRKVKTQDIIRLAMEAWRSMFPLDEKGDMIANRGLIKAWENTGIVPFDPHAISDKVFVPAEAAGKAVAEVRVKAGIPNPSPAEADALVDEVSPFLPPIPVDLESAKKAARRSRPKQSVLMTGAQVWQKAAADLIAKQQVADEKSRKKEARLASVAARAKERELLAQARAARAATKASAQASRQPARKRIQRQPAPVATDAAAGNDSSTGPAAGEKRGAEAAGLAGVSAGVLSAAPKQRRTLHLLVNPIK